MLASYPYNGSTLGYRRLFVLGALLVAFAGCSWMPFIGGKDKDEEDEDINATEADALPQRPAQPAGGELRTRHLCLGALGSALPLLGATLSRRSWSWSMRATSPPITTRPAWRRTASFACTRSTATSTTPTT